MPHLNGNGPENQGSQTGRGLGQCGKVSDIEAIKILGKGMGLRRKSGGGQGHGKRLKSGLNNLINK
jgi:hypothetical protein